MALRTLARRAGLTCDRINLPFCPYFSRHMVSKTRSLSSAAINSRAVKLSYSSFQDDQVDQKECPLIIIHGLLGSKRNWDSLARHFSRTGRKIVTVDCRNHGESPHASEMTYHLMSQDIELLMSDLGVPEAVVLGHSMGGKVAMTLALTKPHLVQKLIVEDVAPDVSRSAQTSNFPSFMAAMKKIYFDELMTLGEARQLGDQSLRPLIPDVGIRNFILTNLVMTEDGVQWRINIDGINNNLNYLISFPKFTAQYTGPVAFIGGANSQHIGPQHEEDILKLFPKASIQHIEGAGHWVHSEKPYEFMDAVLKFIDTDHK